MTTHRLALSEGNRAQIPGTAFSLGVEAVRHRIGASSEDAFPRSMMTAHFTLFEADRRVAESSARDGVRVRLGPVDLRFLGQADDGPATACVEVTL